LNEYEKIKEEKEMEGCTFKPKIISNGQIRDIPIYEKLNKKVKEKELKLETYKETR
jgi:hypothetical protein